MGPRLAGPLKDTNRPTRCPIFALDESIEPTEHFDVKTEHSIGDVRVDPELMALFRGYAARASSSFEIESDNLPRKAAKFENYRAQAVFERLGSMVNRKHGLSAAKDLLRHADNAITAAHYVDSPREATSGLGALLAIGTGKRGKGKKIIDFKTRLKRLVGLAVRAPLLAQELGNRLLDELDRASGCFARLAESREPRVSLSSGNIR